MSTNPARRFAWQDGFAYALAFLAWLTTSAGCAAALLTLRGDVGSLIIAILVRDPYYQVHYYMIGGAAGVGDRIGLTVLGLFWIVYVMLLEEYLRSAIGDARAHRARAASAGNPATTIRWRDQGLNVLARRTLVAAIIPAAVIALHLLLQGAIWLLTRP